MTVGDKLETNETNWRQNLETDETKLETNETKETKLETNERNRRQTGDKIVDKWRH
jgi:hypothetical protein